MTAKIPFNNMSNWPVQLLCISCALEGINEVHRWIEFWMNYCTSENNTLINHCQETMVPRYSPIWVVNKKAGAQWALYKHTAMVCYTITIHNKKGGLKSLTIVVLKLEWQYVWTNDDKRGMWKRTITPKRHDIRYMFHFTGMWVNHTYL